MKTLDEVQTDSYGSIYTLAKSSDPTRVRYVGQTINVERRIKEHKASARSPQTAVSHWIAKNGWENITVTVIEECSDSLELDSREDFWIETLGTAKKLGDGGLNIIESKQSPRSFSRGSSSKLTEAQVIEIRKEFFTSNKSCTQISKDYGVTKTAIVDVIRRYTWATLPKTEEESKSSRKLGPKEYKFTLLECSVIRERYLLGTKMTTLADEHGVSRSTIQRSVIRAGSKV